MELVRDKPPKEGERPPPPVDISTTGVVVATSPARVIFDRRCSGVGKSDLDSHQTRYETANKNYKMGAPNTQENAGKAPGVCKA